MCKGIILRFFFFYPKEPLLKKQKQNETEPNKTKQKQKDKTIQNNKKKME